MNDPRILSMRRGLVFGKMGWPIGMRDMFNFYFIWERDGESRLLGRVWSRFSIPSFLIRVFEGSLQSRLKNVSSSDHRRSLGYNVPLAAPPVSEGCCVRTSYTRHLENLGKSLLVPMLPSYGLLPADMVVVRPRLLAPGVQHIEAFSDSKSR